MHNTLNSFVPGRISTGILSSDRIAQGYSPTSLEYTILVLGDNSCMGFRVKLRITGYGEHKSETQGCSFDDLLNLIEKVFKDMTYISHSGTPYNAEHAEQIQIEKDLLPRLKQFLPEVIQHLQ